MSTTVVDEGVCARVRDAVAAMRRAQFAVLEAVAELDASDVVPASGYRSAHRMVGDLARIDPAAAKRWVAQAKALTPGRAMTGEPLEPPLPATAAVFADGTIDSDHVRVIARAVDAVSRVPDLEPTTVADAEELLAEHATQLSPCGVEKAATRLLQHLDPDGVAPLDPPEPDDEASLRVRRRDGALALSAVIHGPVDVELLWEVFDALSAPAGPDDLRTLGQRRAEALLEMAAAATAEGGIAAPVPTPVDEDELADGEAAEPGEPDHGRVRSPGRPLLMVTIDEQRLRLQVGHGLLDSDRTMSAAEARRLGCDAGVVPVVLGGASQPLDVGRLAYTVPEGMRRALHARDRGCTFPGCSRRARRCHAHHVRHWCDGGETALGNLTLLCRYHHHLVHHDDWEIRMVAGRPCFVPPRWIDPTRRPRPGGPHPVDL